MASMSNVSVTQYLQFLVDQGLISEAQRKVYDTGLALNVCIDKTFHFLSDDSLRKLVEAALKYRDEQLQKNGRGIIDDSHVLGHWGAIVDGVKSTLVSRRERAGNNFQRLVQCGMKGDPDLVIRLLERFHEEGSIDHLFQGILEETLKAVTANNQEEHMYMLTFFRDTIENLQLASALPSSPSSSSSTAVESGAKVGATSANDTKVSSSVNVEDEAEVLKLVTAGRVLDGMIAECIGDVKKLQARLLSLVQSGGADKYFLQVLDDNLKACEAAGYQNKAKLFHFIIQYVNEQKTVLESLQKLTVNGNNANAEDIELQGASTHHAPQFVDRSDDQTGPILVPVTNVTFFDATVASDALQPVKNNKKKSEKRAKRMQVLSLAERVSRHLNSHGWAVIDKFLPLDLARRVKIEANLFRGFYEQSEIWVGKRADMGAHIRVPSVRGDQVLWVCGGHKTGSGVEGMTRTIDHYGTIEPCKLEVKAQAPIRCFVAMRELLLAVDTLMDGLKAANPLLQGIYERSDAMFSIFPGDGSRFARHIDNTTSDGRRLTMVIYLNVGWQSETQGGALRLTDVSTEDVLAQFPAALAKKTGSDEASSQAKKKGAHGASTGAAGASVESDNESDSDDEGHGDTAKEVAERRIVDVAPVASRIVLFLSSLVPHEVLPSFGDRHAISIWFYDKTERNEAVQRAKDAEQRDGSNKASSVQGNLVSAHHDVQAQQEAQQFIANLMGGDDVDVDGGAPLVEELQALTEQVNALSPTALEIVASITGAPSAASFVTGFPMLSVQDLKSMRALFRRMGLQK